MLIAAASFWDLIAFGDTGYGDELLRGAAATLTIAIFAFEIGLMIGVAGAAGKLYGPEWLRRLLDAYTTTFRAIPELVLILLLYYAGTDGINQILALFNLGPIAINGLLAAIIVLAIVQGAYCTEVIRAAIQTIPAGQLEAARAYGLSGFKLMRRITLPAMLPNALSGISNLWLNCTKETALISVVGFTELALATKQAAGGTKRYFAFYLTALLVYWLISEFSGLFFAWLERRVRRGQPQLG